MDEEIKMRERLYNILFVEDEKFVRGTIKRELEIEPFNLFIASSGKEALDLLIRNEFAVIVSDLMMPIFGGKELLEIVRNDFPDTIRIIFSGSSDREKINKILKAEIARSHFIKPFKWNEDVKPKLKQFLSLYRRNEISQSLTKALKQVMEISFDGFILFNASGEIIYSNPIANNLVDINSETLKNQLKEFNEKKQNQLDISGKGKQSLLLEVLNSKVEMLEEPAILALVIKK